MMEKKKFEIPNLSKKQVDQQITMIIQKGLPKRSSLRASLVQIVQNFPKRQFLYEPAEWLFTCVLIVFMSYIVHSTIQNPTFMATDFYSFIFALSPFVFIGLIGFSYMSKKINGTFEIEMTMKYTVYQMLAIRMLLYSVIASIVNISVIVITSKYLQFEIFQAIAIALTGLFIYSAIFLLLVKGQLAAFKAITFSALWLFGNIVLSNDETITYIKVLIQLPILVYVTITIGAFLLFIYALQQFFQTNVREVMKC